VFGEQMMTKETRSTCPYCGVGCGVIIQSVSKALNSAIGEERFVDEVVGVRGDPDHPANFGRLCSKGSTLHLTAQPLRYAQARAKAPLISREQVLWETALDHCAKKFSDIIQKHGPDAVAFYVSGQLLTEDYYIFNKLAKGLIGTNNIDTNSRLCMSSAVAGYKQTLGADAPPACYDDIDDAQCLFIAGSNTAYAHPVLFRRIEDARKRNPQLKVVVVDPRRTDTSAFADLHLPIQPGTDVMLFNAMLHVAMWEGWIKRDYIDAHTIGFSALRESVRETSPAVAAGICGVSQDSIIEAARWFATSSATLSLYCQGLNQSSSGTAKNAALINLHLVTQQIGRAGAGPFSLTGQPNAMGGREVGGLANLISAHRDMGNAEHRAEIAKFWGVPDVPSKPGKTAVELFDAINAGQVKAVWIACTNPAQSMPDLKTVHEALNCAEFVVVQEAYAHTETAQFAHVLLPASTWAEKDGTVTNSERCISRVNAAVAPFGQARHDWQIATQFAQRLSAHLSMWREPSDIHFNYETSESVWNEHRELTRGTDIDITGLSYAALAEGPNQWPFPQGATQGKKRLYEDGVFPTTTGKAQLVVTPYKGVSEVTNARFPLQLNTGRLRDQWHGMSRTGTLGQLFGHAAEPMLDIAKIDAQRRGFKLGDFALVTSKRGKLIIRINPSDSVRSGQAFLAMHWGAAYLGGTVDGVSALGVNSLTNSAFDPISKQPELKAAAIRIDTVELPFQLVAMGFLGDEHLSSAQRSLHPLLAQFDYGSCVPFSTADRSAAAQEGLLLRIASSIIPSPEKIRQLRQFLRNVFGIELDNLIQYSDPRKGTLREVSLNGEELRYCLLVGDVSSHEWLQELLKSKSNAASLGAMLLIAGSQAPRGFKAQGKTVCQCFGVSETQILDHFENSQDEPSLRSLQAKLSCGTQCGSCVPELNRMIREVGYV
jgi:assimilatory nitrate reductase catalytic subunit